MKKYLSAGIGGKTVYIDLDCVQKAIEFYEYRIIPNQKKGVLGITNYQNKLIPVLDFGGSSLKKNLIILAYKSKVVGLAVDDVKRIDSLDFAGQPKHTDIPGVEQFEDGLVLNVERLMGSIL